MIENLNSKMRIMKQGLLEEIESSTKGFTSENRLSFLQKMLSKISPTDHCRRVLMQIHILIHHARSGGLSKEDVDQLIASVREQLQNEFSERDALKDDLHSAISLIKLRDNQLWESTLSLTNPLSEANKYEERQGSQITAQAIRAARLGHLALAASLLENAINLKHDDKNHVLVRLLYIKISRVLGHFKKAEEISLTCSSDPKFHKDALVELDWEKTLRESITDGSYEKLMENVQPGEKCHADTYIIDAYLYYIASGRSVASFPPLKNALKQEDRESISQVIACLIDEGFRDASLREETTESLVKWMPRISEVVGFDTQLVIWASIVRWFHGAGQDLMAKMTISEFHALNSRMSLGVTKDCLGLLANLVVETPKSISFESLLSEGMGQEHSLERRDNTEQGQVRRDEFLSTVKKVTKDSKLSETEAIALIRKVYRSAISPGNLKK